MAEMPPKLVPVKDCDYCRGAKLYGGSKCPRCDGAGRIHWVAKQGWRPWRDKRRGMPTNQKL